MPTMLRSLPPALTLPRDRGTILIMDHEDLARTLVEFKLRACGYDVLTAIESRAALDLLQEHRPDAVILETLGTGDAAEVIEAASMLEIPTLILSSRRAERDVVEAFEHGAVDYITKPFQPGELVARVARSLRQQRQTRARGTEVARAPEVLVHASPEIAQPQASSSIGSVRRIWSKVRTAFEPESASVGALG